MSSCESTMVRVAEQAADTYAGVTQEDTQRVMRGCTAEEFVDAATANPEFLGEGIDPQEYLQNQCEHVADLRDRPVCE